MTASSSKMVVATTIAAFLLLLVINSPVDAHEKFHKGVGVTYDARSLIINGKRELLFSGSIHYPRSTADMWPKLLEDAKRGGINVIQTYVFWNIHEPEEGKQHMERFVKMIVEKLRDAKLFASQGGPIILAQIENEYNTVQLAYRDLGNKYVQWAGNMAVGLNIGVPWIMCKQRDAPGPVINSCNGRQCGDTFSGPNAPNKPSLWTENWTAQFRVFGDPPSQRSAEDTAFSVARWFSKNGSLVNYYMYHGGTNLGRTAASFVTTRYYDEAPIDEFGLERGPKYGHLKDVHKALNLCKKALLWGSTSAPRLNPDVEARIYEQPGTDVCAAFLTNNHTRLAHTVKFKGQEYYLPPRSISILPDCKTVVLNTATILAQHNSRNFIRSAVTNKLDWKMIVEAIPTNLKVVSSTPMELYFLTKDKTDYAWYTTTINLDPRDLSMRKDILPVLRVASLGHGMLAFVNGQFVGSAHGSQIDKSFVLQKSVELKPGINYISLLGTLIGLPDSGAYMEHRFAGPRGVSILGLNTGTLDLSQNGYGQQVGLVGQHDELFTDDGSKKGKWIDIPKVGKGPPLTWYKAKFDAPEGNDPVAVSMYGMIKGMIWINGESIGRYWMSYISPLGDSTQAEYLIPRSYLKPKDNLIVVLEEEPAHPSNITILTVNRDTICSYVSELSPPSVRQWERKGDKFKPVGAEAKVGAHLMCPMGKKIAVVDFSSYGDPYGACGGFSQGRCSSPVSKQVVEQSCLGKEVCNVPLEKGLFEKNGDPCPNVKKTLAIQVTCR
ncbi:unnamed protein product [Linum tenue]|uniref:Beta-galactosidase n=1 Tax=Linum tenue TaxID=586396 RepID=A0AAV0RNB5_9ROSI|nr:unnamed protein product [Linum tenue]